MTLLIYLGFVVLGYLAVQLLAPDTNRRRRKRRRS